MKKRRYNKLNMIFLVSFFLLLVLFLVKEFKFQKYKIIKNNLQTVLLTPINTVIKNEKKEEIGTGMIQINTIVGIDMLITDSKGRKLGRDEEKNIYHEISDGNYIESLGGGTMGFSIPYQEYLINHIVANSTYNISFHSNFETEYHLELSALNSDLSSTKARLENRISAGEKKYYKLIFFDDENNSLEEVLN